MIIQATPYGTKKEEPFAFTYSGDFTDERVDGIGDVTLNTSGVFEVLSGKATVSVYILGAGGGGAYSRGSSTLGNKAAAGGGGGGNQTVEVELTPGTYSIVIGTGGSGASSTSAGSMTGGNGGDTTAFGYISTGGKGGYTSGRNSATGGTGGTPNGVSGEGNTTGSANGGAPNGGSAGEQGGNGLVRITFS